MYRSTTRHGPHTLKVSQGYGPERNYELRDRDGVLLRQGFTREVSEDRIYRDALHEHERQKAGAGW